MKKSLLTPAQAAAQLQQGQVIAYPNESVWGLGCDPFNEQAFAQLLALKQRPSTKGVILVAGKLSLLEPWLEPLSMAQRQRVISSWQQQRQAITWLLPTNTNAQNQLPQWIMGNHQSVAMRLSPHPLVQNLCNRFGGLIVSTSCNINSQPAALTQSQAFAYFADNIDYVAGQTLGFSQPSQIIDAVTGRVIR